MTPKEKAKELFEMFGEYVETRISEDGRGFDKTYCKKQCALIAVDEMMNVYASALHAMGMEKDIAESTQSVYLQEVKQEIEKL
jgi:hypothetical protein